MPSVWALSRQHILQLLRVIVVATALALVLGRAYVHATSCGNALGLLISREAILPAAGPVAHARNARQVNSFVGQTFIGAARSRDGATLIPPLHPPVPVSRRNGVPAWTRYGS